MGKRYQRAAPRAEESGAAAEKLTVAGAGRRRTVRPGTLISKDLGEPCASAAAVPLNGENQQHSASGLLENLGLSVSHSGKALDDLHEVLEANYHEVRGFPRPELTRELQRIVHNYIAPYDVIWNSWQDRQGLSRLRRVFNWGDVMVDAQPYVRGAGLGLWGFSTNTKVRGQHKRLIFLNTAHEEGAVASTIGHELGHYIYASIGNSGASGGSMESMFAQHLNSEEELFCDAVVAMSAYSYRAIADLKRRHEAPGSSQVDLRTLMNEAFEIANPKYRIDLQSPGLQPPWQIRYLTLMTHFFKLRCALFDSAGV